MLPAFFSLILCFVPPIALQAVSTSAQADCRDWQECRDQALAAAARLDYELFHDLAWRAIQKAPKHDAALMTILARAQSLSGRPHDALVMLQRLAAMGVVTDAADSDDFRRVRALPAWADLQASIAELKAARPEAAPLTAPAISSAGKPPARVEPPAVKEDERVVGDAADAVRFSSEPFMPAGLAYDSVSHRFIVGDRRERKLSVIGERSQRIWNLVGAESGGFGEIGSLAIDARQGDLWVASTSSDDAIGARLHKLQLISGRILLTAKLVPGVPPARFADVAVTPQSAVFVLDDRGGRIFRLNHSVLRTTELELVFMLDALAPASIAPASEVVVYVAHADGISRVDLEGKAARALNATGDINLTGFAWIRWHRGNLVGVQKSAEGKYRIARIRLDGRGSSATRLEVLERDVSMTSPSSAAIAGDVLYYLTEVPAPTLTPGEAVVRRVALR